MRTQVGIVGAGPAGLFLSHLLHQAGIDCVVMERRTRAHLEQRIRAGVLEPSTVETMAALGLDGRLRRHAMTDAGLDIRFSGRTIHLDLPALTGESVTIYGQQEVVKDLVAARIGASQPLLFEVNVTALDDIAGDRPAIRYRRESDCEERTLKCDFIAGCDGYRGVSRASIPAGSMRTYERTYDFAWLGVLVRASPIADMTYSNSERGFALCSRRSTQVSRLYLQIGSKDTIEQWPDDRFWCELHARMYDASRTEIAEGDIFQRDIAHLRAFVAAPMQYGRLFLAGDSAHIVPPTGAKGLNLAVADACNLAKGLIEFYRTGSRAALDGYSHRSLSRVWKTVRFATMLTGLLHRIPTHTPLERELQIAELEYIATSRAAQTTLAEQYAGLWDRLPG
ncbi:4-hydroxybenzoate 3-monooxygenase [Bradyrhizobium elkanii]|uniref:4-hydroxybenzoate 3-monooxygenase n=1 Tax=Bradyrhizobium elkanii TaxID=29448 RepID=UPI001BA8213A|nr:4-hydroxybenzoate 3-monooxygenase [Bradyrhizobium elkanii]MBR1158101.1 4-hydroxybenzoate 3-monooxygenase [Bradyrhizobium elkanii]